MSTSRYEVVVIGNLGQVRHAETFADEKSRDLYADGIVAGIKAANKQVLPEKRKTKDNLLEIRIFY